uniref:pre-B-cell leukemia transcription factor 2-like n=1 Tax=Pristiophorus japonicus TaxID=55135 RepID=UPI00398F78B4
MEDQSRLLQARGAGGGGVGLPSHSVQSGLQPLSAHMHENPTDNGDGRKQDIGDILHQIMTITDQSLDEAQAKKHALNCHRMKPALFSVLCEIKEKTGPCRVGLVSEATSSPQNSLCRSLRGRPQRFGLQNAYPMSTCELTSFARLQEKLATFSQSTIEFGDFTFESGTAAGVQLAIVEKNIHSCLGSSAAEKHVRGSATCRLDDSNTLLAGLSSSIRCSSGSFNLSGSGDMFMGMQGLNGDSYPGAQVESLRHSLNQTGGYGEGLGVNQMYSPRDVRANGGWQDAATPSSVTSPTEGPGSVHSETSN